MSKYAYTTVYEEFTGLKPPEPKTAKVRRKRGYGHPYRMRLNMQEDNQQLVDTPAYEEENQAAYKPAYEQSYHNRSEQQPNVMSYDHASDYGYSHRARSDDTASDVYSATHKKFKVTYKKRSHYVADSNFNK